MPDIHDFFPKGLFFIRDFCIIQCSDSPCSLPALSLVSKSQGGEICVAGHGAVENLRASALRISSLLNATSIRV